MSCGGDNFVVPGANPCNNGGGGTAGVTTLNGYIGNVSITAGNNSIGVSNQGGNISLTATGLNTVDELNGLIGNIEIMAGTNIASVAVSGQEIIINASPNVASVNSLTGPLTIAGSGATTVTNVGNALTVNTPLPSIVNSLNSRTGALTIAGAGATTVTNNLGDFTVNTTIPANVNSLNTLTGPITIAGTGGTNVTNVGNAISINTPVIPNVGSVNSLTGALTIAGTGATTVTNVGNAISINTPTNTGVTSLNTRTGPLTITGTGATTVSNNLGAFTVNTTIPANVASFNSLSGAVTISAGTGITLTPSGNNIVIAATPSGNAGIIQITRAALPLSSLVVSPGGNNSQATVAFFDPVPTFVSFGINPANYNFIEVSCGFSAFAAQNTNYYTFYALANDGSFGANPTVGDAIYFGDTTDTRAYYARFTMSKTAGHFTSASTSLNMFKYDGIAPFQNGFNISSGGTLNLTLRAFN